MFNGNFCFEKLNNTETLREVIRETFDDTLSCAAKTALDKLNLSDQSKAVSELKPEAEVFERSRYHLFGLTPEIKQVPKSKHHDESYKVTATTEKVIASK